MYLGQTVDFSIYQKILPFVFLGNTKLFYSKDNTFYTIGFTKSDWSVKFETHSNRNKMEAILEKKK